jgi:hypothetical protein
MDLVLVIDFSTTTQPIYKKYIELSQRLVGKLKIGRRFTRVALIVFSTVGKTYTVFNLNAFDNAADVIKAISASEYTGGTTATGASRLS